MSRTTSGVHHIILRVRVILLHVLCFDSNRLIVSELPTIALDRFVELRILVFLGPFVSEACFSGCLSFRSVLGIINVQSKLVADI